MNQRKLTMAAIIATITTAVTVSLMATGFTVGTTILQRAYADDSETDIENELEVDNINSGNNYSAGAAGTLCGINNNPVCTSSSSRDSTFSEEE